MSHPAHLLLALLLGAPPSNLKVVANPGLRVIRGDAPADDLAGEAGAEVTVTVSAAEGGVHFAVVTMLAVAVSVTEVTEVALAATGICA